ncbi:MAG: YdcF family protein [Bacteroidia bacterium]
MKLFKKYSRWIFIAVSVLLIVTLYAIRRPLMRGFGNILIEEHAFEPCEALFVLSGNPDSRAKEAATLFKKGAAPKIICTGESVPELLEAMKINVRECELSKIKLLEYGINETAIELLPVGTSTREEADAIQAYCQNHSIKKAMVISDRFHTRRICYAFQDQFDNAGITLIVKGAPSLTYSESMWWAKENGLIMVNNEYIKLIYYWMHY